eukprot:Trichotokara_eunicae@DN3237_c0_g1_i3.p1
MRFACFLILSLVSPIDSSTARSTAGSPSEAAPRLRGTPKDAEPVVKTAEAKKISPASKAINKVGKKTAVGNETTPPKTSSSKTFGKQVDYSTLSQEELKELFINRG